MKPAPILLLLAIGVILGLLLTQTYVSPWIGNLNQGPQNLLSNTGTAAAATLSELTNTTSTTGPEVTYTGVFYFSTLSPACATQPHPCKLPSTIYYYLIVGSRAAYTLTFTTTPNIANATQVTVTGMLVSSTTFSLGNAQLVFYGDIYVQSIRPS